MLKLIKIIILISFLNCKTTAQDKVDLTLKLSDLQLTNAPGFSLLDVSPSSIEKPASSKAFSASVVNALNQNNGIPQNYAVEFTPYWFLNKKKMTAFDYLGISKDGEKSNPMSQAKFMSISFAIINNLDSSNKQEASKNASLGIRATILSFLTKNTTKGIKNGNDNWILYLKNEDEYILSQQDKISNDLYNVDFKDLNDTSKSNKVNRSIYSNWLSYKKINNNGLDSVKKHLQDKPWFSLDGAAAINMGFDNNSYSNNRINRAGVWLNATLSIDLNSKTNPYNGTNYLNISALGRYLNDKNTLDANKNYISLNYLDYGLKCEFEMNNISFAYEYVRRTTSQKDVPNTYKSVGLIKYKLTSGVYLTGAIGENFSTMNNLITSLGINWGVSNGTETIAKQ